MEFWCIMRISALRASRSPKYPNQHFRDFRADVGIEFDYTLLVMVNCGASLYSGDSLMK